MAKGQIVIKGILDGQQTTEYQGTSTQFLQSVAIDPDMAGDVTDIKASGSIRPVSYAEFSDTELNGNPIAIITNPKDDRIYVVSGSNGELLSYDKTFGDETLEGTVTGGVANGGFYYNNYIYIPTTTDVSRFGPLDGTPSLTNGVWTGSTLGSQTALTNTSYPSAGMVYPNHWGHVHTDGAAYFCDFKDGQGLIHKIKTTKGTDEGDTDDGSAYNVLDLPFDYHPMDIESYGTDLMISAFQTTDGTLNQGPSALFIWDTTDTDTFYRQIDLQEFPLVTSLKNKGGQIYVFAGNVNSGHSVGVYDGAYGVTPIEFFSDGNPPFQGAVDVYGNRIVWGTHTEHPTDAPIVRSLGYKSPRLPGSAVHTIARATVTESTPRVSAIRYVQNASGPLPRLVIGSRAGTGIDTQYSLDRLDESATQNSVIQLGPFNLPQPFKVSKLRLLLDEAVGSTTSIIPRFLFDDNSSGYSLATINDTNYTDSERNIVYKAPELTKTISGVQAQGEHNMILQLTFNSTAITSVIFPITIEIDEIED